MYIFVFGDGTKNCDLTCWLVVNCFSSKSGAVSSEKRHHNYLRAEQCYAYVRINWILSRGRSLTFHPACTSTRISIYKGFANPDPPAVWFEVDVWFFLILNPDKETNPGVKYVKEHFVLTLSPLSSSFELVLKPKHPSLTTDYAR